MYPGSVVQSSGQVWKIHITTVACWAGIAVLIFGFIGGIYYMLLGTMLGLFGIAFCCLAIHCPECGTHWYWRAIKEMKSGWVKRLISKSECQSCGYGGSHVA